MDLQAFGEEAPFTSPELHDARHDAAGPGGGKSGHSRFQEPRLVGPVGDERPDHASAGQRTRFEREARLPALPELAAERGGMAYQAVEEVDHDDGLGQQFGRRSCDDEGPRLEVEIRGDLNQEGYASVRRGGGHA